MEEAQKVRELQKALDNYRKEVNSMKKSYEGRIKKILDDIDAAKIAEVKKKLGI